MKKTIVAISLFATTFFCLTAQAQKQKEGKKMSGGFGIEVGLPVAPKDFKELFSSEIGISGRFAYKAGPGWITLTPGASFAIPKTEADIVSVGLHSFIKAGYKYSVIKNLFVMGEAGYGSYTIYTDGGTGDVVKGPTEGGICFAPTIGGNFGIFEIGLKYEYTKVKETSSSIVGLRFGLNF